MTITWSTSRTSVLLIEKQRDSLNNHLKFVSPSKLFLKEQKSRFHEELSSTSKGKIRKLIVTNPDSECTKNRYIPLYRSNDQKYQNVSLQILQVRRK